MFGLNPRSLAFGFIAFGLVAFGAHAEIPTINSSARALGMGDAYVGVARDGRALFYNPAGLSFIPDLKITPATVRVGASGKDAYAQVKDLKGDSSSDQFATAVQKLYGKSASVVGAVDAMVTGPHFALAGYDHLEAVVQVDNPVNPTLNLNAINDYGYAAGFGVPLAEDLYFGATGRYVTRTGTQTPFGASYLADLKPDVVKDYVTRWGRGYALDLGFDYLWPLRDGEVTAAAVWRNVGQTHYHSESPSTNIPFDDNDVTVGFAATFGVPGLRLTPAADLRYVNQSALQLGRKFNFGLEVALPLLSIRGGYLGGYYTFGAGVDLDWVRVDAASYGVELGVYPGQREDRRYVAEVSFNLDLSQTFRARRGRLKQRR